MQSDEAGSTGPATVRDTGFLMLSRLPPTRVNTNGYGKALRSGARVTTASMSAIALTIKRAVIGVPS